MSAQADFDQLEKRPGGGGAGAVAWVLGLGLLVCIPVVGYLAGPSKVVAQAHRVMEWTPETVPQGTYSLFPGKPDWGQLELTIRGIKPPPAPVCSDPVTLPWNGGKLQSCTTGADPVI